MKSKSGTLKWYSAAEHAFLKQAWEARQKGANPKFGTKLLVDAMLFSSGIHDEASRKRVAEKHARVVEKSKIAVRGGKSAYQRGEALMAYLHKEVLVKGYKTDQTLWHVALEKGEYNCVSSTAMVFLVGNELGLKFKPLSIPGDQWNAGHAMLEMFDGKNWIEVEATSREGFDLPKKLKRPGFVLTGPALDRKKAEEVDGLGIAAMIYSNRGVQAQKGKNTALAVRHQLAALALFPRDTVATSNLEAALLQWSVSLVDEKKFEEAIRVSQVGMAIAPKVSGFKTNHSFAWDRYLRILLETEKDALVVQELARARKADPENRDFNSAAIWFERHGEAVREKKGWEAAAAVAQRAHKAVSAAESKSIAAWRINLHRRWSQSLLDKKDIEGSLKVLCRVHAVSPGDSDLKAGINYHAQKALTILAADGGKAHAERHLKELRRRFPEQKDLWDESMRRFDSTNPSMASVE